MAKNSLKNVNGMFLGAHSAMGKISSYSDSANYEKYTKYTVNNEGLSADASKLVLDVNNNTDKIAGETVTSYTHNYAVNNESLDAGIQSAISNAVKFNTNPLGFAKTYSADARIEGAIHMNPVSKFNPSINYESLTSNLILDKESMSKKNVFIKGINCSGISAKGEPMPMINEQGLKVNAEAFDGRDANLYKAISVTMAAVLQEQDPVVGALFKTINMAPEMNLLITQIGVKYVTARQALHTSTDISKTFSVDSRPNKNNIIYKNINSDIWLSKNLKAIPALTMDKSAVSAGSTAKLIEAAKYDFYNGVETIETAPIYNNPDVDENKVDLITLASRDSLITRGVLDHTDALDPNVKLAEIFLSYKDTAGTGKLYHKIDVRNMSNTLFTFTALTDNQTVELHFRKNLAIDAKTAGAFNGAEDKLLFAGVNEALSVLVTVTLDAVLDYKFGGLTFAPGKLFKEFKVFNKITGAEVKADDATFSADYAAVKAALADIQFAGFTLDASFTNSNFRHKGMKLSQMIKKYTASCQYTDGVTLESPILGAEMGSNADFAYIDLEDVAMVLRNKVRITGIHAFIDHFKAIETWSQGGFQGDPIVSTPALEYLNPYYKRINYNFKNTVASLQSTDKINNIRSAILSNISYNVLLMARDSNYSNIMDYVFAGKKRGVIIVADPIIAAFLNAAPELLNMFPGFELKIVSNNHPLLINKIYVTFGVFNDETPDAIDPMHFGALIEKTPIVGEFNMTRDNIIYKEYNVFPAFEFIPNLVQGIEYDVIGLKECIDSNTINISTTL